MDFQNSNGICSLKIAFTSRTFWFSKSTSGLLGKFKMAAENRIFANNLRSNVRIFKILTGYVHLRQHSPLQHCGSKNLLPVCSEKFKMATENRVFANNLRSNGRIFKIPSAYVHLRQHSPLEHFGFKNLLLVCLEKLKMAAKNRVFANNLRSNVRVFKIPTGCVH